jgi:hypothetical protein
VTADLEAAGQAARSAAEAERAAIREAATAALLKELARRKTSGLSDLGKSAAEALLHAHGLTRQQARQLLRERGSARDRAARRWHLVPDESDQRKINVRLPGNEDGPATSHDSESARPERGSAGSHVAARYQSGRQHSTGPNPGPGADAVNHEILPPDLTLTPDEVEL